MTRPVDPNISIPSPFAINGTKTDFTNEKIQDGFDDTNPDILAGDNLNKFIDDTYKGLNYAMDGVEDLYDVTDALKDLSNLSASGQAILDNKANVDLSNLSASGQAILDNKANVDLSNLSTSGDNRLHALKGYLDNGTALTDAEGLADVITYAHSTFDLSKFTVIGSPNITDDGIASGFSSSNYITASATTGTTFTIQETIITGSDISGVQLFLYAYRATDTIDRLFDLRINNNEFAIVYKNSGGTNTVINSVSVTAIANTKYDIKIVVNSGKLYYYINGTLAYTANDLYSDGISKIQTNTGEFNGSIDLKQFSITVDGVPVFSGNKTGIDTIKPDDYTEVSSPVISDDGIMTLDGTNAKYVTTSSTIALSTASTWKIESPVFTLESKGTQGTDIRSILGASPSSSGLDLFVRPDGKLHWLIYKTIGDNTSSIVNKTLNTPLLLDNGTKYQLAIEFTGTAYNLLLSTNGSVFTQINTIASTEKVTYNPTLYIGYRANTTGKGTMDLNLMHVYINGNLVYQPCLKIPYTKSKTGSKIADVSVRPRVTDMYEQFGYAPYYTLDEANGNFTLPQGEIYGMINRLQENPNNEIGLPIITISNTLNDNEIWLEGAEVSKTTYAKLYAVYGDNWGTPANNSNFVLPDFRNKTIWGVDANAGWGYISAGLPNITGNIVNNPVFQYSNDDSNGAFRTTNLGIALIGRGDGWQAKSISFDASRSSGIYGNSNTVQPPSTKVRFKTRFE